MKALSLWQPWASLVILGEKRVETRSWAPPAALKGQRIAIHASKRADACVLEHPFSDIIRDPARDAPTGVLLGTVLLEGAWQIEHDAEAWMIAQEYHRLDDGTGAPVVDEEAAKRELAFGDYTVGRWAWGLADVQQLEVPVPWIGRQRLFEVDYFG